MEMQKDEINHVAVTGAGGYIGSVLVDELLRSGYKVTAIDRFFFDEQIFAVHDGNPDLICRKLDIRDVTPQDFEGVHAVCDLAALSNDPSGDIDLTLTDEINHRGRVLVAQAARQAGVQRYVLASSCSVYGHGGSQPLHEGSLVNPLTEYARANIRAEEGTKEAAGDALVWTALRQATCFGLSRRMRFDLVVNLMTLTATERGAVSVTGGGRQWRPLVHVTDAARAYVELLKAPASAITGEIFNLGLENRTMLNVAYIVRENLPFRIELQIVPDDADKRDYNVDFSKLETRLAFTPKVSISEGVREIYDALKSGRTERTTQTSTVGWYAHILDADRLVNRVRLNGRLI